eukprot:6246677-Prymnesium_polylepis.1
MCARARAAPAPASRFLTFEICDRREFNISCAFWGGSRPACWGPAGCNNNNNKPPEARRQTGGREDARLPLGTV